MKHFNQLTPAEAERLALLLEEFGEAQQAIGKVLRHGYESQHPDGGPMNREALETELGHVIAAADLMDTAGDLSNQEIQGAVLDKKESVKPYLHHQRVPRSGGGEGATR